MGLGEIWSVFPSAELRRAKEITARNTSEPETELNEEGSYGGRKPGALLAERLGEPSGAQSGRINECENKNQQQQQSQGTGTKRSFSFHGVELGNKTAKKISRSKTLDFFCFLFLDGEHKAERGYPQRTVTCSD
jgi:hypothetical protein